MNRETQISNFLKYLSLHGVSPKSLKYYKSDLVSFLNWAGDKKIVPELVTEYINSIRLITPTATLNRRISTLRSFGTFSGFKKPTNNWQEKILTKFDSKPRAKNLLSKIFFNRPEWYKKYHSYALSTYIHVAILVLFTSISGYALYDQVFKNASDSAAFPSALTRPNRFLSFQGRLTDNLGNPKTVATAMEFNLYSVDTGGSSLWTGTCSITPDQDGIFSTLLGSSCGSEIAATVFSENAAVWVGVKMGADAEATPRVQIATVAYALNAETLQGYPAGTGTSTIPYINASGNVVLANASPKIQSTSGTFAVEGVAMTLTTPNASDGIITINPDGVGTLDLTFEGAAAGNSANGFVNATNANITSGSLYGGTVASSATGYNFIDFQGGVSPTSKFSVSATGTTTMAGDLVVSGSAATLPNSSISPNEVFATGQTDEYCLTYEGTGTTWEWQTCSTGGGMTGFTAAGDSGGGQSITDSNTLSILGGTNGIDTIDSATDTITLNLDTTEIGSTSFGAGAGITWTFDASAGTDTTLAFGDNTITATTGTLTSTGNLVVQGTTGITFNTGVGGDITFANAEKIDNDTNGTIAITAPITSLSGDLTVVGGDINNSSGTSTIYLNPNPENINSYNLLSNGSWLIQNGVNDGMAALMVNQQKAGDIFTASTSGVTKFTIQNDGDVVFSNKLLDSFVTAGIALGDATSTALSGFGASSLVGALNELKNTNKNVSHNDYLDWANHYQAKAEGTNPNTNETLNGLFFDTFSDGTKMDNVNSTSSGAIKVSDDSYRVGMMGGQTYDSSTADNDGQTYLGSNTINDIYYYDRTRDSDPQVQVELGIDPNWYNGVTLSSATSSATLSQNSVIVKNPNLSTSYNGSLIKATGTDSTNPRPLYITIKSATTFDWTDYAAESATGVTITKGVAQTLGTTGVSVTFSAANYNVGDVFKVASWYIDPEGTNRGAKQQFPERSSIIATASSVDIIDADTQKLWISFDQNASGYAIGVDTNNDPSATKGLNGIVYVTENGSSGTGLYTLDFVHDSTFLNNTTTFNISSQPIAARNVAQTFISNSGTQVLASAVANDIDSKVIPNYPQKEVTLRGWGYVFINATTNGNDFPAFPYAFDSIPAVATNFAGTLTTVPNTLTDCGSNLAPGRIVAARSITNKGFGLHVRNPDNTNITEYICYTWTATGTVSPRQFIGVATDAGITIINPVDQTANSYSDATSDHYNAVSITSGGRMYALNENSDQLEKWKNIATDNASELNGTPDDIWDETTTPALTASALAVTTNPSNLQITEKTSTINPANDTIYVGSDLGVSVIQSNDDWSDNSDGAEEALGSVKHYSTTYISEEMIGDVRGMWPFTLSGSINDNDNHSSVSTTGNVLDSDNANGTGFNGESGVRNMGITLDGTDDFMCSDSNNDNACDNETDYNFTTVSFSVSTWFKHSTTAANDSLINRMYTTTPAAGDGFSIFMDTNGKMNFAVDDDATWTNFTSYDDVATSGLPYNDDQWHHLTAVKYGAVAIYLYIDGIMVGSDTSLTATASISDSATILGVGADCSVGAACATGANFWTGSIDELTITASLLTPSQIRRMYEVGYRALQSHNATLLGAGGADANQEIRGSTNTVGAVALDFNNQYLYVGTNSTTLGALSKIQLNSDTDVKTYNSSANVPAGGTLLIDEDVTSLGVGYQLEAVGSAASGVKSMSYDNNSNNLVGSLFSKTQTLSSATKFAYLWASFVTDSSDASSAINVYACNSRATQALCTSNNEWVLGTTIQTDSNQSTPEREYNFAFPTAGAYMTFKFDLKRGSTKTNTYIERYGATWASSVGGADIAERYKSSEPVYPGDILTIEEPAVGGEALVGLSKISYDRKIVGIVTTNPGIVMDDNMIDLNFNASSRNSPNRPAVALAGRVPVKVSNINGNIEVGDAITSSDTAGVGIKATKAGSIVGKALESFSCEENTTCEGKILVLVNVSWFDPDAYLTSSGDLMIQGQTIYDETGTKTNTIYKIIRIAVNGAQDIVERIGAFSELVAGVTRTGKLEAGLISPVANSDLIIDLDPENASTSSQLAIKGVNDEIVTSFDAYGNATISGTLYADKIESERLTEIEALLAEVESNQSLFAESQKWSTNTATESATISDVIASNLFVTGNTSLTSLFVSDNFTVKAINSLDSTLAIQSLALNPIDIMAGKITIDTNGNAKFLGNVEIAGDLKLGGNIVIANSSTSEEPGLTSEESVTVGEINTNATAGKATLPAGLTELKIKNQKLKVNSLVYITPVSSTQNKVLYVKSKGENEFTVGFNEAIDTDVEFNWWIIELEI